MTGHKFASTAAHSPAHAPNSAAVTRYINHVVSANSAMKGRRTTMRTVAAGQVRRRPGQPPGDRRMIEIPKPELTPGRHHIALVDPEPERRSEQQPSQERS